MADEPLDLASAPQPAEVVTLSPPEARWDCHVEPGERVARRAVQKDTGQIVTVDLGGRLYKQRAQKRTKEGKIIYITWLVVERSGVYTCFREDGAVEVGNTKPMP